MKKKCITIIFLIVIIGGMFTPINVSNADGTNRDAESYLSGKTNSLFTKGNELGNGATKSVLGTIIQVVKIVGVAIAIIMLTFMAIKYMTAAPSEKADFKKSAISYIVGACVLFAMSGILQIIQNFATKNITA